MLNRSDRICGNLLCGNKLTELETQYCIKCMREEASANPPLRRFIKGNKKDIRSLLKEGFKPNEERKINGLENL